ncbi:MAG: FecR domain-containing protein [Betaproteobacteria bacterium]|nr:FecR domain-containing protein [Betaproteobacteria bacterium]
MKKTTFAHRFNPPLVLLTVALAASEAAWAASGRFTFVTGDVRVVTSGNRTVPATRGMEVNSGDLIITGADGMAQLSMVDEARLSLRSQSQMRIESYASTKDGAEGSVLSLLRGTMRTFTGLLSPTAREKYAMRTKVATVGIRGSGNILFHCDENCPPTDGTGTPLPDTTINHTIEGSHNVQTLGLNFAPVISGPGQTLRINQNQPPQFIPTPNVILEAGRIMSGKQGGNETPPEESRNFAAPDPNAGGNPPQGNTVVGNNGLGFTVTDASGNITGVDPLGIRDVVVASGFSLSSQAARDGVQLALDGALRGFSSYAGLQSGLTLEFAGGTLADLRSLTLGGTNVVMGRWTGSSLGVPGFSNSSAHFAYASAGFPAYLSEVLTGTATYALASATTPTNQNGSTGTLGSATLNVNFSNRTLNAALAVTMGGGSWNLTANNVPISLNSFFASTADRLVITNGQGQNSGGNRNLFGSLDGSFIGTGLAGAILAYHFTDQTGNATAHNIISGVAALSGPGQNSAAEFRVGLVSDSTGVMTSNPLSRNVLVLNRSGEVGQAANNGAVQSFAAPHRAATGFAPYTNYGIGTATALDTGFDPATGLSWGRWAGGAATVASGGGNQSVGLQGQSIHYIFANAQSGPTALPLTGTATYDVVGSTRPTNGSNVGTFNSATLNANFTARTVDLGVNFTNSGQTWSATANNVPIYRDLTFGAYAGPATARLPGTVQLNISCAPSCGQGATGAVDGFFTGRNGRGAGMMYHVGGSSGAVAFARRGG